MSSICITNGLGSIESAGAVLTVTNAGGLTVSTLFAETEGGDGSSVLINAIRLQEVYGASMFPSAPLLIREIRFRPSSVYERAFDATLPDLQINLSTTTVEPEHLMLVSPSLQHGAGGELITVQIQMQNVRTTVSGAAFTLDYPTNALRLLNAQAYRAGSLAPGNALAVWNVAPSHFCVRIDGVRFWHPSRVLNSFRSFPGVSLADSLNPRLPSGNPSGCGQGPHGAGRGPALQALRIKG